MHRQSPIAASVLFAAALVPASFLAAATPAAVSDDAAEPVWANVPTSHAPGAIVNSSAAPQGRLLMGPGACPNLICGTRVFVAATMFPAGPTPDVPGLAENSPMALSPDGKRFAACADGDTLTICDTATGKVLAAISMKEAAAAEAPKKTAAPAPAPPAPGRSTPARGTTARGPAAPTFPKFAPPPPSAIPAAPDMNPFAPHPEGPVCLAFVGSDTLLTALPSNKSLSLWSILTKKLLLTIALPDFIVSPNQVSISTDGRFIAVEIHDALMLYDPKTGKRAITMQPSASGMAAAPIYAPAPGKPLAEPLPPPAMPDIEQIAFSNDSHELAAMDIHGRIGVWDTSGILTFNAPAAPDRHSSEFNWLAWLPDGSGWAFPNGAVYLRAAKATAIEAQWDGNQTVVPVGRDKLLHYGRSYQGTTFSLVTLPLDAAKKTVAAAKADTAAPLPLGQPVALDIHIGKVRGDAKATEKEFTEILTRKLQSRAIRIDSSSPVSLRVDYEEKAGETRPIYVANAPGDPPTRDPRTGRMRFDHPTGASATGTVGSITMRLIDARGNDHLARSAEIKNDDQINGPVNDAALRANVVAQANGFLEISDIPAYIPSKEEFGTLPLHVLP